MSLPPELPSGLPPLPKSLSAAATARGVEHLNHKHGISSGMMEQQHSIDGASSSRNNHREGSLSSTQDSTSDRDSVHSRASSSLSAHDAPTSTSTLDTQIALLRREMYSLRQLDLSLLSQLWALNESIQSFRTVLQDREDVTPSPTPSNTNSISSDDEPDDHSFSPLPQPPPAPIVAGSGSSASQASTSTSASNSLSAANTLGNHVAPKMPKHSLGRARSQQSDSRVAYALQSEVRTRSQQSVGRTTHAQHYDGRARSQQSEERALAQMSDSSAHSQQSAVGRSQSQDSGGGGITRVHPQLPPILQQRMRRPPPPPPPPPSRGSGKSPNRQGTEQKLSV